MRFRLLACTLLVPASLLSAQTSPNPIALAASSPLRISVATAQSDFGRSTYRLDAEDHCALQTTWFDSLTWRLFVEADEWNDGRNQALVSRRYVRRASAGRFEATKRFDSHHLTYAAEWAFSRTKTSGGYESFPDTRASLSTLHFEDEITLRNGDVTITPALRLDSYRMNPEVSEDFQRQNLNGFEVAVIDDLALSPALAVVVALTPEHSFFVEYERLFRSPPHDQSGIVYTDGAPLFRIDPEIDLRPEISDGFRIGMRGDLRGAGYALTAHYNDYDDFIDLAPDRAKAGYRYENIRRARAYGVEASASLPLDAIHPFGKDAVLDATLSYSAGDDLVHGGKLSLVEPFVVTVALQQQVGRIDYRFHATHAAGRGQPDGRIPDYSIIDARIGFELMPRVRLVVEMLNVFDDQTWRWSNAQFLEAPSVFDRDPESRRTSRIGFELTF